METKASLAQEWSTLQNNYEAYERGALWLKLAALLCFFAGVALVAEPLLACLVLLVLWLQEGIFKTYQARLGERLLELERWMCDPVAAPGSAFQLHSSWLARRKSIAGLLVEYLSSACRPTVAFPYAVLLLAALVWPLPP